MRGLRDGTPAPFDQEDPPATGTRPATDAVIGGATVVSDDDGVRVTSHADTPEVTVTEVACAAGAIPPPLPGDGLLYVLEGAVPADGGTVRWLHLRA